MTIFPRDCSIRYFYSNIYSCVIGVESNSYSARVKYGRNSRGSEFVFGEGDVNQWKKRKPTTEETLHQSEICETESYNIDFIPAVQANSGDVNIHYTE